MFPESALRQVFDFCTEQSRNGTLHKNRFDIFQYSQSPLWLIAEFNVARLGILSYGQMKSVTVVHILLSLLVFGLFGTMFYKMSKKHTRRIHSYEEETRPFWNFFDKKAYLIMIFMMSGGIWLRSSGLAPNVFIAVFYTGLGCALALAGVSFGNMYLRYAK